MAEKGFPFRSLSIAKPVVDVLEKEGFVTLSPIQEKVIPILLKEKSVLALSPTGTGKTLAYLAPLLTKALLEEKLSSILLFPTVALMDQVYSLLKTLAGSLFDDSQIKAIRANKDFTRVQPRILLTTPHLYPEVLSRYDTSKVKDIILDEGDMLIYDGFDEILTLLAPAIKRHQVSFFSASLPVQKVREIRKALSIDEVVDVRDSVTWRGVRHHFVFSRQLSREEALIELVKSLSPTKMMIFVSKGEDLALVGNLLRENHIDFLSIQGKEDKRDIRRKVEQFRKRPIGILLGTDYLSRGIDVPDCLVVLSYDLPKNADYYFHRAGRTGRFGTSGDSYVLVPDEDQALEKARQLQRREPSFDLYAIGKDGLKAQKGQYLFRNLGKKDQSNDKLQKQIRHAVNKNKSNKVKPNYKKKVKKAVDLVKLKHRRKVVRTNIAKSGGNAQDYHEDTQRSR